MFVLECYWASFSIPVNKFNETTDPSTFSFKMPKIISITQMKNRMAKTVTHFFPPLKPLKNLVKNIGPYKNPTIVQKKYALQGRKTYIKNCRYIYKHWQLPLSSNGKHTKRLIKTFLKWNNNNFETTNSTMQSKKQ